MKRVNSVKINNSQIAREFGVTEGAIRHNKLNSPADYFQQLRETRSNNFPFVPIDDYVLSSKLSKEELLQKIQKEEIPAYKEIKKDYRGQVKNEFLLVPYNAEGSMQLRDEYKELNITKVFSVVNRKGGVGKTTNSIQIASVLAELGYDILFVDYDTQANASQSFGLKPKVPVRKSIVDIMLEVGKGADENIVRDNIFSLQKRMATLGKFDVLPNTGTKENAAKAIKLADELMMYSTQFKALDMTLDHVKNDYDFVIIDTPPNDKNSLTMVTMATDYFIFSYKPDERSINGVPMMFSNLKDELEPIYKMHKRDTIKIIGGIISDYNPKININRDMAEQAEEDFNHYIKRFNLSKEYKIFTQRIDNLQKFSKIQDDDHMGSLLSPFSLSEKLTYSEMKVIRKYFEISEELVERVIIDEYANSSA